MMKGCLVIFLVLYLISPIDLIPEILFGPFGVVDDILGLLYFFYLLTNPTEASNQLNKIKEKKEKDKMLKK